MSSPNGGPKDETAPKVLSSSPDSSQLNVKPSRISIEFNEYVKTNNINELLIISPRIADRYETSIKNKTLFIDIPSDSLKDNTTYTLSLNGSIVDVNESNPLDDYQLYFSTGNFIDSLKYHAVIIDAFTKKPCEKCIIALYSSNNDSLPLIQTPDYVGRTNTSGYAIIDHLPKKEFQLVALEDENKNLKLDPNEKISLLQHRVASDSSSADTFLISTFIVKKGNKAKLGRAYPGVLKISFEYPVDNDSFSLVINDKTIKPIFNRTQDTLTTYLNINERDTFSIDIIESGDTQNLQYIPQKLKQQHIKPNFSRPDKNIIQLKHSQKLTNVDSITLIQDSVAVSIDSIRIKLNEAFIYAKLKETKVQVITDSLSIIDFNNSYSIVDTTNLEYRKLTGAALSLHIQFERKSNYIIQLLEGSKIVKEEFCTESIDLNYPLLKSGTYNLKIIEDLNNNKRWDGGDYFKNISAEPITISETISLRENWDKELTISNK